jgi:hypothetical protein
MPQPTKKVEDKDFISIQEIQASQPGGEDFIKFDPNEKLGSSNGSSIFQPENFGVVNLVPKEQRVNNWQDVLSYVSKKLFSDYVRPIGDAAAASLAGASALPAGPHASVAAGMLGWTATDLAMQQAQKAMGEYTPSVSGVGEPGSTQDMLAKAGELGVLNELGGMAIRGVGRFGRSFFEKPVSINPIKDKYLDQFNATFAQRNDSGIARVAEDVFAGGAKKERLADQGKKTLQVSLGQFNKIKGTQQPEFDEINAVARETGNALDNVNKWMQRSASRHAKAVRGIGRVNAQDFEVVKGMKPSSIMGPDGKPVMIPETEKIHVNGPVNASNIIALAEGIINDQMETYGVKSSGELLKIVEDKKKQLITTALDLLRNKKVDAGGNVIPIPFEAAWDFKKAAGSLGGFEKAVQPGFKETQFRNLSAAADNDIVNSVSSWKRGGQKALELYETSKMITANRKQLLESGDPIQSLISSPTSGRDDLDKILSDPLTAAKAIYAGGAGIRKNLAAYRFQRMIQGAYDNETNTFKPKQLVTEFLKPENQAVNAKLYSVDQRNEILNLFRAIDDVSQKQSMSGKVAAAIRIGSSGAYLSGEVLSSVIRGNLPGQNIVLPATIMGGALGTMELAKRVMMNPKGAKYLTALVKLPPSSPETVYTAKQLFNYLNGTRMFVQDAKGLLHSAEVKNGKIEVDPEAQKN